MNERLKSYTAKAEHFYESSFRHRIKNFEDRDIKLPIADLNALAREVFGHNENSSKTSDKATMTEQALRGRDGRKLAIVMHALFAATGTYEFSVTLSNNGLNTQKLADLVKTPFMSELISAMVDDPEKYNGQLAYIFSRIPREKLPENINERIPDDLLPKKDIIFRPGHSDSFLCDKAEPRLLTSIKCKSILTAYAGDKPAIMIKYKGVQAGLSLIPFLTEDGKMVPPGVWLKPVDDSTKDFLNDKFDRGVSSDTLPSGDWALFRPSTSHGDMSDRQLVAEALREAHEAPVRYPANIIVGRRSIPRDVYRKKFGE